MNILLRILTTAFLFSGVIARGAEPLETIQPGFWPVARSTSCLSLLYAMSETSPATVEAISSMRQFLTTIQSGTVPQGSLTSVNVSEATPLGIGMRAAEARLLGLEADNRRVGQDKNSPTIAGVVLKGIDSIRAFEEAVRINREEITHYRGLSPDKILFRMGWATMGLDTAWVLAILAGAPLRFPIFQDTSLNTTVFSLLKIDWYTGLLSNTDFTRGFRARRDLEIVSESGASWSYWADTVLVPPKLLQHENLEPKNLNDADETLSPIFSVGNNEYLPINRFIYNQHWTRLSIDRLLMRDEDGKVSLTIVARSHPERPEYPKRAKNSESVFELLRGLLPSSSPSRATVPARK